MKHFKICFVTSPLENCRFQRFSMSLKKTQQTKVKNPKPFQPAIKKKCKAISAQQSAS